MNKKLYIRLMLMVALTFLVGLSFSTRAMSANNLSLPQSERLSPSREIQAKAALAQDPVSYSGYREITDNEEKIRVQVPVEWSDIETGVWLSKGKNVGVFVAASGDLGNFYASRAQPGVFLGVSSSFAHTYDQEGLLGLEKQEMSKKCLPQGRFPYQTKFYEGNYDQFTNCAEGVPNLLVFTAASADKKLLILVRIVAVSEADLEAVDKLINSFQVLGNPEKDDHHQN